MLSNSTESKHSESPAMRKHFSKRYSWYPNGSIVCPYKFVDLSQTPAPKTISTAQIRQTSGISNNPYAKISANFANSVLMDGFGDCAETISNQ